jgi:hypothetical protein
MEIQAFSGGGNLPRRKKEVNTPLKVIENNKSQE